MVKSEKELEEILRKTIIEKGVPTQVVIDNDEEFVQAYGGRSKANDTGVKVGEVNLIRRVNQNNFLENC